MSRKSEQSFRVRLHLAIGALALVIAAAVAAAYFGARAIDRASLESEGSQAVLAAHISLSSDAFRLFKHYSDAAVLHKPPDRDIEKALTESVNKGFEETRRSIAYESMMWGNREDEGAEIDRIAALEAEFAKVVAAYRPLQEAVGAGDNHERQHELATLIDKEIDGRFASLIEAAIAEEEREVNKAEAQVRRIAESFRMAALAVAAAAALLTGFLLFHVNAVLLPSLGALRAGAEAFARGALDHPIPSLAYREFQAIRDSFASMAADLSASRNSLEAANARLEGEVADRTEALAGANRRLEENDAARRRFFADISHELRTPLTVILGEAEISMRGADRPAASYRESLGRIVQIASETSRLVEDLFYIARADVGEPPLELQPVAIGALLAETVSSFEAVAAAKGVRLVHEAAGGVDAVEGDRRRLRQVFSAVLDNAVRYSRDGGEVRVRLFENAAGVAITIEDDGIGVPEDARNRVFDRFFRAANARAHAPGTGLGLPVAKAIVEAHKGSIMISPSISGGVKAQINLLSQVSRRVRS